MQGINRKALVFGALAALQLMPSAHGMEGKNVEVAKPADETNKPEADQECTGWFAKGFKWVTNVKPTYKNFCIMGASSIGGGVVAAFGAAICKFGGRATLAIGAVGGLTGFGISWYCLRDKALLNEIRDRVENLENQAATIIAGQVTTNAEIAAVRKDLTENIDKLRTELEKARVEDRAAIAALQARLDALEVKFDAFMKDLADPASPLIKSLVKALAPALVKGMRDQR